MNHLSFSRRKQLIANFGDRDWTNHVYKISNEYGLLAIAYANHDADAIDAAMDSGHLDSERMSNEDYAEYEREGWGDSYILAGNASEPIWCEYLHIQQIK